MRDSLDAELVVSALRKVIAARRPSCGLIHHSDRGSQYGCDEFRDEITAHGMRASMSRKGDCWDNAVLESFFATLELELIVNSRWGTRAQARVAVFGFIQAWYNRQRLHATLVYLSPEQYEMTIEKR